MLTGDLMQMDRTQVSAAPAKCGTADQRHLLGGREEVERHVVRAAAPVEHQVESAFHVKAARKGGPARQPLRRNLDRRTQPRRRHPQGARSRSSRIARTRASTCSWMLRERSKY